MHFCRIQFGINSTAPSENVWQRLRSRLDKLEISRKIGTAEKAECMVLSREMTNSVVEFNRKIKEKEAELFELKQNADDSEEDKFKIDEMKKEVDKLKDDIMNVVKDPNFYPCAFAMDMVDASNELNVAKLTEQLLNNGILANDISLSILQTPTFKFNAQARLTNLGFKKLEGAVRSIFHVPGSRYIKVDGLFTEDGQQLYQWSAPIKDRGGKVIRYEALQSPVIVQDPASLDYVAGEYWEQGASRWTQSQLDLGLDPYGFAQSKRFRQPLRKKQFTNSVQNLVNLVLCNIEKTSI